MTLARNQIATLICWLLAGFWALWALVRVLGLDSGLPLVALVAFTPYVAVTAFIPVAVALVIRNWAAVAVALVAAVALVSTVLPRAFGGPTEAEGGPGTTVRVLAANMRLGKAQAGPLADLVRERDVDVLSVEELTPELAGRLDAAGLAELLPHRELATGESSRGSGLYSRFALGPGSVEHPVGGFPLISERLEIPGAADIEASAVHVVPPTVSSSGWSADLGDLPAPAPAPVRILLGDFNATLDQGDFRDLLGSGYEDVADTLGDGLDPTWPDHRRVPPLIVIDHVLVDGRVGIRGYAVEELPGSDHRAVYAELELPRAQ